MKSTALNEAQEGSSRMKEISAATKALFEAAENGDFSMLIHRIENTGADLTERDPEGNTVLAWAVNSGNLESVRYLVERCGLDPAEENNRGETPWDMAVQGNQKEILDYFAQSQGYAYEESFHNPIRRGFFPDPSVVRVGEDFYMVNSSFAFFPCIPISHSKDLINWNIIGYAITKPEYARLEELYGGRGYWAPDISYCDGRFFITATLRGNDEMEKRRLQMVTSSNRPEGPYDEPVFLDIDGIDPSIFHDEDGRKYMLINKGARILELSRDCTTVLSHPAMLWYGDWKIKPEGPHLLKRGEYYYLFLAEGGTGRGHRITVARAKQLKGPYEPCPYNPILRQWDESALTQCCGHGKPFQLPDGRWYLVYLGLRMVNGAYGILGRETFLAPLHWTEDGWPVAGKRRKPEAQMKRPLPSAVPESEPLCLGGYPMWKGRHWMTPRPLQEGKIRLEEDECLLTGSDEDLNAISCRSILVERQTAFCFEASCGLRIPEMKEGQSLGLVCYYDENSYIKFGVFRRGKGYKLMLAEFVGDSYQTCRQLDFDGGQEVSAEDELYLKVEAENLKRRFSWSRGREFQEAACLTDTSYLSSEGLSKGKRFTGAAVGIYVHGSICGRFTDWQYKNNS